MHDNGQGSFDEDSLEYNNGLIGDQGDYGRSRRSLLGFLSPALSAIFGIPSEASWKLAQSNLKNLHQTTEALKSSLGCTLQIINVTNANVLLNRAAITDLATDLRRTRTELNVILSNLQARMDSQFRLHSLIERIQALFHVAQSSLRMAMYQLLLLKSDLELAKQGNFAPTLIPASQLRSILRQIKNELPRDTYLPRLLKKMHWYYNLPIHLLSDGGYVYLILDLPLINLKNRFNLYQVVQLSGLEGKNKLVWDINAPYIAVSLDKERYVILTHVDAQLCKHNLCKPNVAAFSYTDPRECVLALFKNDTQKVWTNCNMLSEPLSLSPKLTYPYGNVWLAENCKNEVYNVICDSIVRPTQEVVSRMVTKQLEKISLPSECWIKGRLFTTPKMLTPAETFQITPNVTFPIGHLSDLQVDIEGRRPYQLLTPDVVTVPDINDMAIKIASEQDRVDEMKDTFVQMSTVVVPWYWVAGPLIVLIFVLSAMFCYV